VTPALLTFDIFGTVVDWRQGLNESISRVLSDEEFDSVVDFQGREEQGSYRPYREIVARSLTHVLHFPEARANAIGAEVGRWPIFPDAQEGLRRLMSLAPCIAMTNSDRNHGEQVQTQLGFRLSRWVCAEEVRLYKPHPDFWRAVSEEFGPHWWHVSAYADYDLEVAHRLGLTTVFVRRPHARPGEAGQVVSDLVELASHLARAYDS